MSRERRVFEDAVIANRVTGRVLSAAEDEEKSDGAQMLEYLEANAKRFKKGHAWWVPPHNLAINSALMAVNLWRFTILPFQAGRTAYRPAGDRFPEGIVIDPNWDPFERDRTFNHGLKTAEVLVKVAKAQPSISESVKDELESIERHFKIQIPPGIVSHLVGQSLKVAERRWGVDGLRRKRILVPFDGGKSIELGSWD